MRAQPAIAAGAATHRQDRGDVAREYQLQWLLDLSGGAAEWQSVGPAPLHAPTVLSDVRSFAILIVLLYNAIERTYTPQWQHTYLNSSHRPPPSYIPCPCYKILALPLRSVASSGQTLS